MKIIDIANKVPGLPPEAKEILPLVQEVLENDATNADLRTIIGEVEAAFDAARKEEIATPGLKEAFNAVADVIPAVGKLVEKKGDIGFRDMGRYLGLAKNHKKYLDAFDTLGTAFESGDPAVTSLAQSLAGNKKFVGALDSLMPKLVPAEKQALLQDKGIRDDLAIIIGEVQKAVNAASTKTDTAEELKEAFLRVDTGLSAFSAYAKNLSLLDVPQSLVAEFIVHNAQYKKSGEVLAAAYKAEDPAILELAQSLRNNETSVAALKRIVPKTHGQLFKLELDEATGQGYAVELVSGNNMKFALEKADFDEISGALKTPPKQGPKPQPGV